MRFTKILLYSTGFSLAIFGAAFFFNFIPCFSHPNIINPDMTLNLCNLDPQSFISSGIKNKYFFFTYDPSIAYLTTLISSFILAFLILSGISKKLSHLGFHKKKHKKQKQEEFSDEE